MRTLCLTLSLVLLSLACGDDDKVSSEEEARLAYLGIDAAIDRALNLGMAGFNAAQSANIPTQTGNGTVSGTLTVSGQVDQGASDNKGMRLSTAFVMYQDLLPATGDAGAAAASRITYDTDASALPALNLTLRNIPKATDPPGTFTGTLAGTVHMTGGRLDGDVTLMLNFSGNIRVISGGSGIERVPGSTHVTGTATSKYGTYAIDLTR